MAPVGWTLNGRRGGATICGARPCSVAAQAALRPRFRGRLAVRRRWTAMSMVGRSGWMRWWLCGWLFVATGLSFLDRQVLSVLAPEVTARLGMTNSAYSHVNTAFLVSYAVMFLLGGRLMDLAGTRRGMALSVGLWSLASALHAVARMPGSSALAASFWGWARGAASPAPRRPLPRRSRSVNGRRRWASRSAGPVSGPSWLPRSRSG